MSSKLAASAFILVFLYAFAVAGTQHREIYPFSSFPMFSNKVTRTPDTFVRWETEGVLYSGAQVDDVYVPMGRASFMRWQGRAKGKARLRRTIGQVVLDHSDRVRTARGHPERLAGLVVYKVRYESPFPHPEVANRIGRMVHTAVYRDDYDGPRLEREPDKLLLEKKRKKKRKKKKRKKKRRNAAGKGARH
jgi:hypothetical protein